MNTIYSDPPRTIPFSIKIGNLFGGFINQFGWIFFSFGLIFVWTFTMQADLTSWYHFRGNKTETYGILTKVSPTDMTINKRKVYKYEYSFEDEFGEGFTGISYSNNSSLSQGKKVLIEFPNNNPDISRIKGMTRGKIGLFGLFPLIFPLIGVFFMFFGIKKGLKANRLLTIGFLTEGKLIDKQITNTRVNNKPVIKLTFKFHARDGMPYKLVTKTHRNFLLEDNPTEKLLYDRRNPKKAIMLDTLNTAISITDEGIVNSKSIYETVKVLFIPIFSLIIHGTIIYYFFI